VVATGLRLAKGDAAGGQVGDPGSGEGFKTLAGSLGLVQRLLSHSRSGDTLRYIGIDQETMDAATLELNLR
jgi:hypothetical protein